MELAFIGHEVHQCIDVMAIPRLGKTCQELDIGLGFLLAHRFSRLLSFLGFRPLQERPPGIEKCLKFRWLIVGSTGSGS